MKSFSLTRLLAGASLLSLVPLVAQADPSTWQGTTSAYNTNSNWNTGVAPVTAGESAIFTNSGGANVNVSAPVSPDGWTFSGIAFPTNFTGSAVTIGSSGIVDNSINLQTITINNNIAGTGGVTMASTAQLTLTGANTYSGATQITNSSGGLQIGNGVAAGSSLGTGAVTNNGLILVFDLNNTGTTAVNNVISGSGELYVEGTPVTLTAANTYSGGTRINTGTAVTIAPSGANTDPLGSGVVTNYGTLTLSAGINALTVPNGISGTGSVTVNGTGMVTFNGVNTYTGGTAVTGGVLEIGDASHTSAQIVGAVSVGAGGTIKGHGLIGALTNTNGTVSPGGSIGTLTVASYSQGAAGTFQEEVSPTGGSELNVTGAASLAGSLVVTPDAGTYTAGTTFTIINAAGGLTGTFSTVNLGTGYGLLVPSLNYTANDVLLSLKPAFACTSAYATTASQLSACGAVVAGGSGSGLFTAAAALAANPAAVPPALDSLSGEVHESARAALLEGDRLIRDTVIEHLADADSAGLEIWGTGFASSGSIMGDGNTADLHHTNEGVIVGADMPVGYDIRVGVAAAFNGQSLDIPARTSHGTANSNHILLYADWAADNWNVKVGEDYGWGGGTLMRTVSFLSETDTSPEDHYTSQVFGDVGYDIKSADFTLEPHAGLAWAEAHTSAFSETGGALSALHGGSQTDAATYMTLGLRGATAPIALDDMSLLPKIDLGWQHAFSTLQPGQMLAFIATGAAFQVEGVPLASDAATLRLGADLMVTPNAKLSLYYDGMASPSAQDSAIDAGFNWAF